jgi:hypothetical protein
MLSSGRVAGGTAIPAYHGTGLLSLLIGPRARLPAVNSPLPAVLGADAALVCLIAPIRRLTGFDGLARPAAAAECKLSVPSLNVGPGIDSGASEEGLC